MDEAGVVELGRGRFLRLVARDGWEFAERMGIAGIVMIVPVTDDGKLVLVEQYRPPVGARVIELPAGLVGDEAGAEGEAPARAAARELFEETGYEAARVERVWEGPVSPGATSESVAVYVARGLKKVGPGGGAGGESIRVHEAPLNAVCAWLRAREREGARIDLKVFAGVHFARA